MPADLSSGYTERANHWKISRVCHSHFLPLACIFTRNFHFECLSQPSTAAIEDHAGQKTENHICRFGEIQMR
jgi:hypothetical protein